jgi:hypothetical protein
VKNGYVTIRPLAKPTKHIYKMDMLQLDHLQSLPNTFMYYIDRSKLKKTFDQVERPI